MRIFGVSLSLWCVSVLCVCLYFLPLQLTEAILTSATTAAYSGLHEVHVCVCCVCVCTYIHAYIHTHIHAYIHTCIHT